MRNLLGFVEQRKKMEIEAINIPFVVFGHSFYRA